MDSIDESYTYYNSDNGSISKNALEEILDGIQIHPDINARYARLKICDRIKETQSEWKEEEISAKNIGKYSHKIFKAVVNALNNSFPNSVESGSEVSHFITEPRNIA